MAQVAVVGGGAMGGLWAARLAEAGNEVTIVDVSPQLLAALGEHGITVEARGTSPVIVRVAAVADPVDAGPQDVVFVFVKGPHTRAAGQTIGSLLRPDTALATLQNGWGNADVLAEHVDPEALVVGVTYHGATLLAPGRVRHDGQGPTFVGPYQQGGSLDRAERVGGLMRDAGFECTVTAAVLTDIWRKLVHNAACLPVAALTDLRTSELVRPGPTRDLIDALAREAVAVARAQGHQIDETERIERIHAVLDAAGMGIPSMLSDTMARRPTEIATINGAVVRAGESSGVATPLNRAMVALIAGLEQSWQRERS